MTPVLLSGLSSVLDRTLFTHDAPIVKRPLALLTGADLVVTSATSVRVLSASFTSFDIGKTLSIVGSLGGRNDGTFEIVGVPNSVTAELKDASFDVANYDAMVVKLAYLANDLKATFAKHRVHVDTLHIDAFNPMPSIIHAKNDIINTITTVDANDLLSAIALLNDVRIKFHHHIANFNGDFHTQYDYWNATVALPATSPADPLFPNEGLASAMTLANELRTKYDAHRLERRSHLFGDTDSRVTTPAATSVSQSAPGSLVGPFVWTLYDQRLGTVADSSDDVAVWVNGSPVGVDAVFGMFGAIVLSDKPLTTDVVTIDYDFMNDPPARFLRLNSPEFVLNQDQNNGIMGMPGHKHRARSYLIDPGHTPDLISSVTPLKIGWKYKAFERAYTASLNDPAKLLLNSPTKKIRYPVLQTFIKETTLSYDPTTLPENATDPWTLEGEGLLVLANGLLTIIDNDYQVGIDSKPPFYTHTSDIVSDSLVSAAFRVRVDNYQPDGVFTGVGFGLSDGFNVILAGFVQTEATNLSSAISVANVEKANFNAHMIQPTVHGVDDTSDIVEIVDAHDLQSLIILSNALKLKYGLHIDKADPTFVTLDVHKNADVTNEILAVYAKDLDTAIALVNELRLKFNAHRSASGVHFVDDIYNEVFLAKQVGILTNTGAYEFQDSWNAGAIDWSILKTYRVHRDAAGDAYLYLSGDVTPMAYVPKDQLPCISDFEGKFDPVQQIFFGSISREAVSSSTWNLLRANIVPLDSNLVEDNKAVEFGGTTTPELAVFPWITLGHGGTERVYPVGLFPGGLLVDSTCSAQPAEIVTMGASSGAFRGYMRLEPMLAPSTTCAIEFRTAIDYYTFSLGNRADGVFIDDGQLSVHFAFLHFSPGPAKVFGSVSGPFPFPILPAVSDKLFLSLDGSASKTVSFNGVMTAAMAAIVINAAIGVPIASDDGSGRVQLTYGLGASSYVAILGGTAAVKLGMPVGKYFGRDSTPERRISWFSDGPPDQEPSPWTTSGGATVQMIGAIHAPVMRLTDSSTTDYGSFTMSNPVIVNGVMDPPNDWKLDFRLTIQSFTAGDSLPAILPLLSLNFAGALVNIEEGYGGKNVELHLATTSTGAPYLNLVTYNSGTNTLDPIAQYAFTWNDGETHSFNIYTNKDPLVDQLFVYADGSPLTPTAGTPTYSSLGASVGSVPSVTFGTGGEAVSNLDLRTAVSVSDWESVAVFRDSKIADPTAGLYRYVGVYLGGDPTLMNSWNVSRVDWTSFHTYRIVRDPTSYVAVYLDDADVPIISIAYDPIRLPPCSSSFLQQISNNRSVVAWGAFSSTEISRTRWQYLKYSMGKLSLTDRIVPPHQVLNQANVMASPDHGMTAEKHAHYGFSIYSGGTPDDDFMSNTSVPAYTILGENFPPVPMTQNLESRGGLVRSAVPASGVPIMNFMDYGGFLGLFEDDVENVVTTDYLLNLTQTLTAVTFVANDASVAYENHRVRHDPVVGQNVHGVDDVVNFITTPPAIDLPTSVARLFDFQTVFNNHVTNGLVHTPTDPANVLTSPVPFDLDSCIVLANEISSKYDPHLTKGFFHFIPSSAPYFDLNPVVTPDATDAVSCSTLLTDIKQKFVGHTVSSSWHGRVANHSVTLRYSSIIPLANQLKSLVNQHMTAPGVHAFDDSIDEITVLNAQDASKYRWKGSYDPLVTYIPDDVVSHVGTSFVCVATTLGNDPPNAFFWYDVVTSAILLTNQIKASYNAHIFGQHVHRVIGLQDAYSHAVIPNPSQAANLLASDLLKNFGAHVLSKKSHVEPDFKNEVRFTPPGLPTIVDMANALKEAFNAHRTATSREIQVDITPPTVHVKNDVVNVVAVADATDLDSAIDLLNAIKFAYENHRTQIGVHGSSAFIRLEPPSRVLYEGMKFWTTEDGTRGLVRPGCDDNNWRVSIVSIGSAPGTIVAADTLDLRVDNLPVSILFQAGDNTLSGVVTRINATVGYPLATIDTGEVKLTSPTPGPGSSLEVIGGTAVIKLGLAATSIIVGP